MGERPFLMLLPGMLCDDASWRAQVEALADVCTPRVASYGVLESFAAIAEAVLAAAPDRFALAGHSMGGRAAQEICRRAPKRVERLALIATDYRGPADDEARAAEAREREAMLARVAELGMEGFARAWAGQVLAAENLADEALVAEVVAMMARHSPQVLAAQTRAGLDRPDHADLLPTLTQPTLVIAGAHDRLRPMEIQGQIAALIPHGELVVVQGAGHMVAMERPEEVTARLRAWLAAEPRRGV